MTTQGKLVIFSAVCFAAWLATSGGVSVFSPSVGPVAVLIMEETAERSFLPESQLQILNSTELREWAESGCDKDEDGIQFRVVDKDIDTQFMSALWRERIEAAKSKPMPYMAVSNGKSGAEGDLPLSVDEVKSVLKRYSGK